MKRKILIFSILIIIVSVVLFFVFNKPKGPEYVTVRAETGDILQTVSETGAVESTQEVDLSFLQSGQINKIYVAIGDNVTKDQILAELDNDSLKIKLEEAQANLEVAQANLDKVLSGATNEEISVLEASEKQAQSIYLSAQNEFEKIESSVAEDIKQAEKKLNDLESDDPSNLTPLEQAIINAETNLENTKNTYSQTVYNREDNSLIVMEDKIAVANTALDEIDSIINNEDIDDLLSVQDKAYLVKTQNDYDLSLRLLGASQNSLAIAKSSLAEDDINQAIQDNLACLNKVFSALSNCFAVLENSITSSLFTQTDLDTAKITINTQLTTVSTAISSVQNSQQNLADAILAYNTNVSVAEDNLNSAIANFDDGFKTAKNILSSAQINGEQQITMAQSKVDSARESWNVAKAQLNKIKSPARSQDVVLSQAQVKQAKAALDLINKQIEDSTIRAPFSGTIVKVEYDEGEQINGTMPVISMLGESDFEIKIDISETDISKIEVNDKVKITLDAFGEDVIFSGVVDFIEPAETVIQEVIYYKVTVKFDLADSMQYRDKIKSGMTANVEITTAEKSGVLILPGRAVLEKNGRTKYVRRLINGELEEVVINVGLRGDEGLVEIISGINEGDEIVSYVKDDNN